MAEHASLGKKLLADSKYEEAVAQFTSALKASPTSPDYLIQRSTAYQRSKQFPEALKDAELAVIYAQQRAKRESILQAQLRRGIALFNLERYGDARLVLGIVKRMDAKEKTIDMWINKAETKLKGLPEDDEKAKVSAVETPDINVKEASANIQASATAGTASTQQPATADKAATSAPAVPQATPADKIRHEWYQNVDSVFFTLFAKGVPKDKIVVDISETSLSVSFPIGTTTSTYDFTVDPFFAHVQPSKSRSSVLSTKVEIVLAKATPGQKWATLEGKESLASRTESSDTSASKDVADASQPPKAASHGPAYPTSSKSGPKNWDKIVSENSETGKKEDDDDDTGGDDASKFFKKLFKGSSAETQRAMMKSYVESNGTALSTDWSEVSKGKVETVPPDGMESKKW